MEMAVTFAPEARAGPCVMECSLSWCLRPRRCPSRSAMMIVSALRCRSNGASSKYFMALPSSDSSSWPATRPAFSSLSRCMYSSGRDMPSRRASSLTCTRPSRSSATIRIRCGFATAVSTVSSSSLVSVTPWSPVLSPVRKNLHVKERRVNCFPPGTRPGYGSQIRRRAPAPRPGQRRWPHGRTDPAPARPDGVEQVRAAHRPDRHPAHAGRRGGRQVAGPRAGRTPDPGRVQQPGPAGRCGPRSWPG